MAFNVNYIDKTSGVGQVNTSVTNATFVLSDSGANELVSFSANSAKRITDMFGLPVSINDGINEAIDANRKFTSFIMSSYQKGYAQALAVLATGTGTAKASEVVALPFLISDSIASHTPTTAISCALVVGVGANTITVDTPYVTGIAGLAYAYFDVDSQQEEVATITGTELKTASGVVIATGVTATVTATKITLALTVANEKYAKGLVVTFNAKVDAEALILAKYGELRGRDIEVRLINKDQLRISTHFPKSRNADVYEVAINNADAKSEYGFPVYVDTIRNNYWRVLKNSNSININFPANTKGTVASITLGRGYRQSKVSQTAIETAFNNLQYVGRVNVLFSAVNTLESLNAITNLLKSSKYKYSRVVSGQLGLATDASGIITAFGAFSNTDRRVLVTAGLGEVINYAGRYQLSNFSGRIASNYCDSALLAQSGLPVAGVNQDGVGGELGDGIVRLLTAFGDTAQNELRVSRINPIVRLNMGAYAIMGLVTRYTGTLISFNESQNSDVLDYIAYNFEMGILERQYYKFNTADNRRKAQNSTTTVISIYDGRTNTAIESYAVKCDEENNNAEVRKRREFVVDIALVFNSTNETVNLNFIVGSTGDVASSLF